MNGLRCPWRSKGSAKQVLLLSCYIRNMGELNSAWCQIIGNREVLAISAFLISFVWKDSPLFVMNIKVTTNPKFSWEIHKEVIMNPLSYLVEHYSSIILRTLESEHESGTVDNCHMKSLPHFWGHCHMGTHS